MAKRRFKVQVVEKTIYTRIVEVEGDEADLVTLAQEQAMDEYANDMHDIGEYDSAVVDYVLDLESGVESFVA